MSVAAIALGRPPLVLLDVPADSQVEREFIGEAGRAAPRTRSPPYPKATIRACQALVDLGAVVEPAPDEADSDV